MAAKVITFINEHLTHLFWGAAALVIYWRIRKANNKQQIAKKVLEKATSTKLDEPLTLHPEIDPAKCAGCGSCTKACPEGDILGLIDHKAALIAPTKCVGHGECANACPFGAITLVFGTKKRGMDLPNLTTHYETNVPGLYIAGELGGMGLIRNAVKQGALAAQHAIKAIKEGPHSDDADVDLLIVGAGPAGLSASLAAIAENRSYLCIEQNSFGGTVSNFPRQKIVMSHPAKLPVIGRMQFPRNKVSKEELLEYWNSVRKKVGLKVTEQTTFQGLEKIGNVFVVKTNRGEHRAKKVILSMGVRGSPRRLGLANEDLPKVTYNLIDPEQYQNKDIVVVGGGNAGVEAAQYLAKEKLGNKVKLLVRGEVLDRCNEENQKILFDLEKRGLVKIWFNSKVAAISPTNLTVDKGGQTVSVPNDYLFVFAGADTPHKFLMSLGVSVEKKFGEALKKKAA